MSDLSLKMQNPLLTLHCGMSYGKLIKSKSSTDVYYIYLYNNVHNVVAYGYDCSSTFSLYSRQISSDKIK